MPKRMSPEVRAGAALAHAMWERFTHESQFTLPTWRNRKRTMVWLLTYSLRRYGVNKRYEDLLNMAGETANTVDDYMLNNAMDRWVRLEQKFIKDTIAGVPA